MRKDDKIAVFDAKFKTMQGRQKDVDLSDLRQIHTYAGFFSKDQDLVVAGLLYPCEKEPTEKWASNICSRTMNETKFIVDGINLENIQIDDYSTAFNQLVIEEKKFVERLRRYLD